MYITTTGLVLKRTPYMDSSAILTVLSQTEGRITVAAKGVKRKGSKLAAPTQTLAFSEMTLYNSHDRWTLTDAKCIETFDGLRDDVSKLALGAYFAEVLEAVSDDTSFDKELLTLGLNCLFALSENIRPADIIKAAFELKTACLAGFLPSLDGCAECGEHDMVHPFFYTYDGMVRCDGCRAPGFSDELCPSSLAAMRHIISADKKKLLSFTLGTDASARLSRVCEDYLKAQLDRDFRSLSYYYSVKE